MSSLRLQKLQKFLDENPNDAFILFAIAKEYEKANDWPKALAQYRHLEETQPDYVGTYYHLGKCLEQLEDTRAAFFTYKKGMEVAKKIGDQHSLSELAAAKLYLGDDEDFL